MKNQFGFIERADVVKEIFFHYSEYDGNIDDIELGDDVSFKLTDRNVSRNVYPYEQFLVFVAIKHAAHLLRLVFIFYRVKRLPQKSPN